MNITMALDIILSLKNRTKEIEELRQKLFDAKMKHGGRVEIDEELQKKIEELSDR
jgi:hypothetical protein